MAETENKAHELFFEKEKGWGIRRRGNEKTIKFFPTKLEALERLVELSENNDTKIVVRKKNGQFQKFDSAKMALSYAKKEKDES